MSARRLPLQEGFRRLLPFYDAPAVVGEMIEAAWRENRLRLYCNGTLLAPGYIKRALLLLVMHDADGRPQCRIGPAGPLGWEQTDYIWEVDAEGFEALAPPTSTLKSTRRQTWRHSPRLKS